MGSGLPSGTNPWQGPSQDSLQARRRCAHSGGSSRSRCSTHGRQRQRAKCGGADGGIPRPLCAASRTRVAVLYIAQVALLGGAHDAALVHGIVEDSGCTGAVNSPPDCWRCMALAALGWHRLAVGQRRRRRAELQVNCPHLGCGTGQPGAQRHERCAALRTLELLLGAHRQQHPRSFLRSDGGGRGRNSCPLSQR